MFLNPSQVWLEPPGYVTQMFSRAYQPNLLKTDVTAAPETFDVAAKRSDDGKTLVVEVVNTGAEAVDARLELAGFKPAKAMAAVEQLVGPPEATNTAAEPKRVVPTKSELALGKPGEPLSYRFPAYSVTVIRLE